MSGTAWNEVGTRAKATVSHPWEREAVVLLFLSGWSISELSMVFEVNDDGIRRVLRDEEDVESIDELRANVREVHQ